MSRSSWLIVAALCALVAAGAGALSGAYRGTLVRVLRERHPEEWRRAGAPAGRALHGETGLLAFAHRQRYFALNDADLVSEARNFYYNRLAAYIAVAACIGALAIAARTPR